MRNPMNHSAEYRRRRFSTGSRSALTYATYYMGRYNLNVSSTTMMDQFHLSKADFGMIATAGFWTYALAVAFNGPLADRIGGKKSILIGAAGACVLNLIIGLLFLNGWQTKIIVGMSLLYAVNQYFQSFGALSVVKVNAPWFHVKERGIFGGVFGIMISSGYFLALTVGGWILAFLPWYWVFLIPSMLLAVMFVVDAFLVKDKPSEAGFPDFDTGDATSKDADKDKPVDFALPRPAGLQQPDHPDDHRRRVLHRLRAPGRDALVRAVPEGGPPHRARVDAVHGRLARHHGRRHPRRAAVRLPLGPRVPVAPAAGGVHLLPRRRSWPCSGSATATSPVMAAFLIPFTCMWIFGVHGMLSATSAMDFGGTKAAATVAGICDGVQYLASGLTGFCSGAPWTGTAGARGRG